MPHQLEDPFCNECGYDLTGLTDSSKCPECGGALVEVLMRPSFDARRGIRYTSKTRFLGLPLVAIAAGRHRDEKFGKPVGIVAIGDFPRGVVAVGNVSIGLVSIGAMPVGLLSLGGIAIGGIALGGLSLGALALGGLAIGGWAFGGLVMYLVAGSGGTAIRLL